MTAIDITSPQFRRSTEGALDMPAGIHPADSLNQFGSDLEIPLESLKWTSALAIPHLPAQNELCYIPDASYERHAMSSAEKPLLAKNISIRFSIRSKHFSMTLICVTLSTFLLYSYLNPILLNTCIDTSSFDSRVYFFYAAAFSIALFIGIVSVYGIYSFVKYKFSITDFAFFFGSYWHTFCVRILYDLFNFWNN
ncbi:MAG: hypothetical protein HC788_13515 [Sphingopyxis sp.]|nr:hypothetical protein [Sphingopyxis sp.]